MAEPIYEDEYGNPIDDPDEEGGPVESGSGSGSGSFDASAWLDELESKYGVSDTPEDLAEFNRKNPEDISKYMSDLEAQYQRRGSNIPGGGDDDDEVNLDNPSDSPVSRPYGGSGTQGVFQGDLQQVGQDPFSQAITGGYGELLEGQGATEGTSAMLERLMSIIEQGGRVDDPALYAQKFEAARQPIDSMRKAQIAGARGTLANRGLLSEPGMPQGSEIGAMGRIEEDVAPWYASAGQQLASELAQGDDARLSQALTLATGLSQAQAQNYLQTLKDSTQRQGILSEIALGTLDRNILWNQFLAEYGMDRDIAMESITSGRQEDLATMLALFQQYVSASAGGYI